MRHKNSTAHDVVSALQAEHRYAARLLDVLDEKLAAASHGKPLDRDAVRAVMTYMTQHLDGYHHRREDAMFARLGKRDPHLAKGIAAIESEHRTIGAAGKKLLGALEGSPHGGGDEARVVSGTRNYVSAMRAHMNVEERDLLPRAREVLDEHDLEAIDRDFARVVDPIFEASVRDAYAAYTPVVRSLVEEPAVRQTLGALDAFFASALTLADTLFGGTIEAPREPGHAGSSRKTAR